MRAPFEAADVRFADAVVIGRITDYRLVRDMAFRRKMLANPKLDPALRRFYKGGATLLGDYARFAVVVERVLSGRLPGRVIVTWDNSTFGVPATLSNQRVLIALRRPGSDVPPLRGPSATVFPVREPGALAVLQAPCAAPFLFAAGSVEANAVRRLLPASGAR